MVKKISCPRCSTVLKKYTMSIIKHSSGALLDVCNNCGGMWLDKPEVSLLYKYSQKRSKK